MKKLRAYLRSHRREKIDFLKLLLCVMAAILAIHYLPRTDGYEVIGGLWGLMSLLYLYAVFFKLPGEKKIDPKKEAAEAEAQYRKMLAGMDDSALRTVLDDPLRSAEFKSVARGELEKRGAAPLQQ